MVTSDQIVEYARTWIGAKWRHQGRGEGTPPSLDCAGLLILTARHFDIPHADLHGYGRDPSAQFIENIEAHTHQGSLEGPLHGAIGIFNDRIMPCHTGILAADRGIITVIHSECRPRRQCHEEPFEDSFPSLRSRLVDIRLFKDVIYE